MKEKTSTSPWEAWRLNLPSASEVVPTVVPLINMFTPGRGSELSVTVPVIARSWANVIDWIPQKRMQDIQTGSKAFPRDSGQQFFVKVFDTIINFVLG
jgi:hypothetical protein